MKKSTLAVAALLTTLSTATIMPAAYADDTAGTPMTTCQGCAGACAGSTECNGACAGSECSGS
ncbi:MAG TPA: hypothetical protein DDY37_03615 [Legionella sp.]|nr:hypothetical protein [Legionella sp.]